MPLWKDGARDRYHSLSAWRAGCGGTLEGSALGTPAPGVAHRVIEVDDTRAGRTPIEVRFWAKVDVRGDDDCWEWTGCRKPSGYGQLNLGKGKPRGAAYRLSYEWAKGPIPEGQVVMHSCDNPPCVNPAHLSVGTQRDNALDMVSKGRSRMKQTHCKNGHERTPENLYDYTPTGRNWRSCKPCALERASAFYYKNKGIRQQQEGHGNS